MVYYYFPTKDDLFFAVVDDVYALILPDVATALAGDTPLRHKLGAVMRRLAGGSDVERAVMRIAVRDILVSPTRRARLFALFQRGHIPLVLGALARAQAQGEIRADAPLAMMVFSAGAVAVFGALILEHLPLPGLPVPEARIEIALDLLFGGLSPRVV
jgi:AcrR family transcriptional regulator